GGVGPGTWRSRALTPATSACAGAHQLSLPLRNGWNMVATERLLIAIAEEDERYASERYGDQSAEGGANAGFPIVGCLVGRQRATTPAPDRGSCEGGKEAQASPSGMQAPSLHCCGEG